MTVFDLLKQLELEHFCSLTYVAARDFESPDDFMASLQSEVTEEELQRINEADLKEGRQPLSFLKRKEMGDITQGVIVEEKKYINQDVPQVTVSFQLSAHDWNLLKATPQWAWVQKLVLESQRGGDVDVICINDRSLHCDGTWFYSSDIRNN